MSGQGQRTVVEIHGKPGRRCVRIWSSGRWNYSRRDRTGKIYWEHPELVPRIVKKCVAPRLWAQIDAEDFSLNEMAS